MFSQYHRSSTSNFQDISKNSPQISYITLLIFSNSFSTHIFATKWREEARAKGLDVHCIPRVTILTIESRVRKLVENIYILNCLPSFINHVFLDKDKDKDKDRSVKNTDKIFRHWAYSMARRHMNSMQTIFFILTVKSLPNKLKQYSRLNWYKEC